MSLAPRAGLSPGAILAPGMLAPTSGLAPSELLAPSSAPDVVITGGSGGYSIVRPALWLDPWDSTTYDDAPVGAPSWTGTITTGKIYTEDDDEALTLLAALAAF